MRAFSVTDAAVVKLADKERGRHFLTIQPVGGDIWIKYDDTEDVVSSTTGQRIDDGTIFAVVNTPGGAFSGQVDAIADIGTVDVRVQGGHVRA